ncbi:MAG: hypothetical protein H7175_22885 [Burkholderiales bacterium]|nr:hypothetical protein [Anaerolineae bacterium]
MPYTEEFQSEEAINWLKVVDLSIPSDARLGKLPTPDELITSMEAYCGSELQFTYKRALGMDTASINLGTDYLLRIEVMWSGVEHDPPHYSFAGDITHLIKLISYFPPECGTLLLIFNDGEPEGFFHSGQMKTGD